MIKYLLAFLLFAAPVAAQWVEGSHIGIPHDSPKQVTAVFFNDYAGIGPQPGVWTKVNVQSLVGSTATPIIGVMLGGLGVVTKGTSSDYCNLRISFRRPGTTYNTGNYISQVLEAHAGGGQRSPTFVIVPVDENGNIEYFWQRQSGGTYPTYCANAFNLSLQAYIR